MDDAQQMNGGDEVWSTAVQLRPHWKRRLLIILSGMLVVCVGAGVWAVMGNARTELPQDPVGVPYT